MLHIRTTVEITKVGIHLMLWLSGVSGNPCVRGASTQHNTRALYTAPHRTNWSHSIPRDTRRRRPPSGPPPRSPLRHRVVHVRTHLVYGYIKHPPLSSSVIALLLLYKQTSRQTQSELNRTVLTPTSLPPNYISSLT